MSQVGGIIKDYARYGQRLMEDLTQDELKILMSVLDKVLNLSHEVQQQDNQEMTKKIRRILIE